VALSTPQQAHIQGHDHPRLADFEAVEGVEADQTSRSAVGGATVGATPAAAAQDADGAEDVAQNWQDAVAAHHMLVVAARRRISGARGQHVDVLAGRERGGRHGEGQASEEVGELHVVWWGEVGLEKLNLV